MEPILAPISMINALLGEDIRLYKRDISTPILFERIERSISELTASKHRYFLDKYRLREICGCLIRVTPRSSHFSRDLSAISFALLISLRMVNLHAPFFSVREESKTKVPGLVGLPQLPMFS